LRLLGALTKPVPPQRIAEVLEAVPAAGTTTIITHAPRFYSVEDVAEGIAAGQLVNYDQPQVTFATVEVVGMETLVRWQHPRDGLVFPDRFMPAAGSGGLSEDRSDWDCLRRLGCDCAQGYFIARPMPASALPAWLRQWSDRRLELLAPK